MKMGTTQLLVLLEDIKRLVRAGDSFDGTITYSLIPRTRPESWEVTASYRFGNREGQGGMRVIQPAGDL